MDARRTLVAALAVLISAAPAAAQTHKAAISLFGGGATYSNLASGSGSTIRLQNGWLTGGQLEIPFGRLGLRLNGSYTDRPLLVDSPVDLNVFTVDLDVMMRLLPPAPDRLFSPYVALGAGAAIFKLGPSASNTGVQISGGGSVQRPTVMGALGTDIGSGPVAFRVELSDIMQLHSPLLDGSGSAYGPVHHVAASAGVSFRLGRARAAPMRLTESEMAQPVPTAAESRPAEPAAAQPKPQPGAPSTPAAAVAAAPATPAAAKPAASAPTAKAPPKKPSAESADSALAARFNAWDKVESLEVEIAALKRQLAEIEASRKTQGTTTQQPTPSQAAAVPAATPTTPAPSKAVYHGTLYTVQIASYLDGESPRAARAVAELKQKGVPVWVTRTGPEGRIVNRVRVGALPDKAAAESLSRYINRIYDWPTWVTPVESSTQVRQTEVTATQAFVRAAAR
jgi:hypothetical protein